MIGCSFDWLLANAIEDSFVVKTLRVLLDGHYEELELAHLIVRKVRAP